jgi:hypothetical protein
MGYWEDLSAKSYCNGRKSTVLVVGFYMIRAATPLRDFLGWFSREPSQGFTKASVQKYRSRLEVQGLSPSSVNQRLAAIRKLANEAAEKGRSSESE